MSQAGLLKQSGNGGVPTNVPISFVTDSGTAVSVGNVLDVFGGLGITTSGAGQVITITNTNSASITVNADIGSATPAAGVLTLVGSGSITTVAAGSTVTTQLQGLTNHNVLIGAGTTTITKVAPSATVGIPLISQGAAADPIFGTVSVAGGGTGATSLTGVLTGNGTSPMTASPVTQYDVLVGAASNLVGSVGPGTAGQVLQSGGNAANPAYSTATYPSVASGAGTILRADGTNWLATTATYPNTTTTNQILYSSSNNIIGGLGTANKGILTTNGTGVPGFTTLPSDGQLLIGSGAGVPAAATLTAGTGVTITNASNSITIGLSAALASVYQTNSGNAIPAAGVLSVLGTGAVTTSGSGSTISINVPASIATLTPDLNFNGTAGTAISGTASNINVLGATPATATVTETYNSTGAATGSLKVEHRAWQTPFVVDASTTPGARGTFSTIASAIAAASSGQTVFIRAGTYTENLTLKAGVNLIAFKGTEQNNSVQISGKMTANFSGTGVILSNIDFTNTGDNILLFSGSSITALQFENCFFSAVNTTAISITNSNASAFLKFNNTTLNLETTGIAYYVSTGAAQVFFYYCTLGNTGSSTTASTNSANPVVYRWCTISTPLATSGTGLLDLRFCDVATGNTTAITTAGTGTLEVFETFINSGLATAISVGSGTTARVHGGVIASTNTNTISGAGTLEYEGVSLYYGVGGAFAATTTKGMFFRPGITLSQNQPAFSYIPSAQQNNCTGDGTTVTVVLDSKIFDQANNFGANTFTAPYTGKYQLSATVVTTNIGPGHTSGQMNIVTTNRTYLGTVCSPAATRNNGNTFSHTLSVLADMNAGDTARVTIQYSNSTKTINVGGGSPNTVFTGVLIC